MRRKKILVLLTLLFAGASLWAQNVSDLIISEALALPDSASVMDGYGRKTPWIELFNRSTGTVNYGGCFITDSRKNLKKSLIPKSDLRTKLGPRQSVILFCSGNGNEGTFYAGITLEPGKTVYLVSNDGRTIIDSLSIPVSIPRGHSVVKLAGDLRQMEFETSSVPALPTPGALNGSYSETSKAEKIAESDPHGFTLTVVSVSVVFTALAILWFLFWLFFERPAKRKARPKRGNSSDEIALAIALALDMESDGDTYAAIAAAVHLYLTESVHDTEPGIVTIVRKDSPWNNKALNFRQLP